MADFATRVKDFAQAVGADIKSLTASVATKAARGWAAPYNTLAPPATGTTLLAAATKYGSDDTATPNALARYKTASGITDLAMWSQFPAYGDTFAAVINQHRVVQAAQTKLLGLEIAFGYVGDVSLAALAAGSNDDFLKARAAEVKAYGVPTHIRFNWEMNGAGFYPWSGYDANSTLRPGFGPSDYVAAWKHVVDIFRSIAPNAEFVWCPFLWGKMPNGTVIDPIVWYPGDEYVDVIATNYYPAAANFQYSRDGDSNIGGLNYFQALATTKKKLFKICEFGVNYTTGTTDPDIGEWYQFRDWMNANNVGMLQYFALVDTNSGLDYELQLHPDWATQIKYETTNVSAAKYIQGATSTNIAKTGPAGAAGNNGVDGKPAVILPIQGTPYTGATTLTGATLRTPKRIVPNNDAGTDLIDQATDPVFQHVGAATLKYNYGFTGIGTLTGTTSNAHPNWSVISEIHADAFEIVVNPTGSSWAYRLIVDGVMVTPDTVKVATTAGTQIRIPFTFPDGAKVRKLQIDMLDGGFMGVALLPKYPLTRWQIGTEPLIIGVGDSISSGTSPSSGYNRQESGLTMAMKDLGITNFRNVAIAGTGFYNPGSEAALKDRTADFAVAGAIVVFYAGINDVGQTTANRTAAMDTCFQAVVAAGAQLVVIGLHALNGDTYTNAAYITLNSELKARTLAAGGLFIDTFAEAMKWVTGNGHLGTTGTVAGSASTFVYTDDIHPTWAGAQFLGKTLALLLRKYRPDLDLRRGPQGANGAVGPLPVLKSTSTTLITLVASSYQTFALTTPTDFAIGSLVRIASSSDPGTYGFGTITAISPTSMTVNMSYRSYNIQKADWIITLTGDRGATGAAGTSVTGPAGAAGPSGPMGPAGTSFGPVPPVGSAVGGQGILTTTTGVPVLGTQYWTPFSPGPVGWIGDAIIAQITTALTGYSADLKFNYAIYPVDPATGFPDTSGNQPLLYGSVLASAIASVGIKSLTFAFQRKLPPGNYWISSVWTGTTMFTAGAMTTIANASWQIPTTTGIGPGSTVRALTLTGRSSLIMGATTAPTAFTPITTSVAPSLTLRRAGVQQTAVAAPASSMPSGDYIAPSGESYTPIWSSDFDKNDVAVGGDWTPYGAFFVGEDGTKTTSQGSGTYRPYKVLSVASSALHWALGYNSTTSEYQAAKPAPLSYQSYLYGSVEVKMKVSSSVTTATLWKTAFLNWPSSNSWADGEIDWAENDGLYSQMRLASVRTVTDADFKPSPKEYAVAFSDGAWHTIRMEWGGPTATNLTRAPFIKWYVDGVLKSTITDPLYIPSKPMTVFLQVEPAIGQTPTQAETATVDVDWLVISQMN